MAFLESTYRAAADLGGWDVGALGMSRSASRGARGRFRPARRPRFGGATWAALR